MGVVNLEILLGIFDGTEGVVSCHQLVRTRHGTLVGITYRDNEGRKTNPLQATQATFAVLSFEDNLSGHKNGPQRIIKTYRQSTGLPCSVSTEVRASDSGSLISRGLWVQSKTGPLPCFAEIFSVNKTDLPTLLEVLREDRLLTPEEATSIADMAEISLPIKRRRVLFLGNRQSGPTGAS